MLYLIFLIWSFSASILWAQNISLSIIFLSFIVIAFYVPLPYTFPGQQIFLTDPIYPSRPSQYVPRLGYADSFFSEKQHMYHRRSSTPPNFPEEGAAEHSLKYFRTNHVFEIEVKVEFYETAIIPFLKFRVI